MGILNIEKAEANPDSCSSGQLFAVSKRILPRASLLSASTLGKVCLNGAFLPI